MVSGRAQTEEGHIPLQLLLLGKLRMGTEPNNSEERNPVFRQQGAYT